MPFREWLRKLLEPMETQQAELERIKKRSDELLVETWPDADRRTVNVPVQVDRRKKP